ncbi:hypothetical protein C8Q80DRAFT_1173548 [Daedaleopsis nitida]|nr:hypothetical protein C8Q80DRAFT_1173548 [Daedaleopsis nitida]
MESRSSSPTATASPAHTTTVFSDSLSVQQRKAIQDYTEVILRGSGEFAKSVGSRLELREVSVFERPEDGKLHAEVVFELDGSYDMSNSARNVHGGCIMFLIDVCSSITLVALSIAMKKEGYYVSQALTTVFHSPAPPDARLRITNKTTSFGTRTVSARIEVWDLTNRRLVATAVHNQMHPSQPKL